MSKKKKRKPLPTLEPPYQFVDTHCHLDMDRYADDMDEVIKRSFAAGVKTIITIGIDLASSEEAVAISSRHKNVYGAVGIHPHYAPECNKEALNRLKELAANKKVIAYGEIGIDRYKDYAPIPAQINAFTMQLHCAKELNLPVIIHDRDAHAEILSILKEHGPYPAGGIIHCFSGDKAVAQEFLELGFHLSIPGVVTFKKATQLQEATAAIPLNRLLIETDGPFLAPEPYRGKRNEPAYILYTAEKIASLQGISLEELAVATSENVQNLFKITL